MVTRRWDWYQLKAEWAQRLVSEADLPRGALVLDIGAGRGAVTDSLLSIGARVVAVEAHAGRAQHLRERFGASVVVVQVDAADLRLPRQPYHVVANPPFALTTPLLRRLLQSGSRLRSAHLILQEQAAKRWAGPTAPGIGRWCRTHDVSTGRRIPRSAFDPAPPVDGRVLVVRRHAR
ncbi:MAG: methyltransferase domain-containing protein [Actinobacteria bacterium]|nr:methyltransferase domain-containing protein [Actinomycetota bacterium]